MLAKTAQWHKLFRPESRNFIYCHIVYCKFAYETRMTKLRGRNILMAERNPLQLPNKASALINRKSTNDRYVAFVSVSLNDSDVKLCLYHVPFLPLSLLDFWWKATSKLANKHAQRSVFSSSDADRQIAYSVGGSHGVTRGAAIFWRGPVVKLGQNPLRILPSGEGGTGR